MSSDIIRTADDEMKRVLCIADNVATSRATILITGESGTGKELMARYIHSKSSRANNRFFAINCAAVPENLLESELFGYEKGAFTGADARKAGKFELANGSTFLLDEISELPMLLQAKLLRVIQEGEIERLGGQAPIKVDVRLVAATNKDLSKMVEEGKFREDLYYRLNVVPIEIPPLRSRPKDVRLLSQLFLEMSCSKNGIEIKSFDPETNKKMLEWTWPGNIRELQNVIERSVLLTQSKVIENKDLLIDGYKPARTRQLQAGMTVSEAERLLIIKTLEYTGQNRTQAAQMLGISIRTLRNKLNDYRNKNLMPQAVAGGNL